MKKRIPALISVILFLFSCMALSTFAEEPHEHVPGELSIENEIIAGCMTDGSYDEVYYCTVCGEEMSRTTVVVPASGHTPGEVVYENTIPGSHDEVVYCTVCEEELSRVTVSDPVDEPVWEEEPLVMETPPNYGTCGLYEENLTWILDETGKLTIAGIGEMADYQIEEPAPWYGQEIKNIEITEGVTSIGSYAFNDCEKLESVAIPVSVTSIGDFAFQNCTELKTVDYDGSDEMWSSILISETNTVLAGVEIKTVSEETTPTVEEETDVALEETTPTGEEETEPTIEEISAKEEETGAAVDEIPVLPILATDLTYNGAAQNLITDAEPNTWIMIISDDDAEEPSGWIRIDEQSGAELQRVDAGTYDIYWYYGEEVPEANGTYVGQVTIAKADAVVAVAPAVNSNDMSE